MSIRFSWLCAVLLGGAVLPSLSACSDSSNVGLGVGPDSLQGGQPVTLDVIPTLDTTRTRPITGENLRKTPARRSWRFLAGVVDDPIPGTGVVEAEGYIDFAGRNSLPAEILSANNADSLTAELRLTTNYLHGASDEPMAVKVYDLTEEATMDSARANTRFDADEMETASTDGVQIVPTDSLVTIELRQSWIDEHLTILQDTSNGGSAFEDNFSGFKLVAPSSQAVVGFSSANATLRLTHTPDSVTADYASLKTSTHIEQRNVTDSPPNNFELIHGGVGVGLAMEWAYGEKEFRNENPIDSMPVGRSTVLPLNRAEIFVPVDTSEMKTFTEAGFARPFPKGFRITATRHSDSSTPSCSSIFRARGLATGNRSCVVPLVSSAAPGAALVSDNFAFRIFQQSFRRIRNGQTSLFTKYRVHVADRETTSGESGSTIQPGLPSTLPALIQRPSSPQQEPGPPRATLTVTPL